MATARPLDGKVALVTGAARGLGRRYCQDLVAAGASVVAADRDDCSETVELAGHAGGAVVAVRLDVVDLESCRHAVAAAQDAFGTLDSVVNNAALYATLTMGPFDQLTDDEWDAVMNVNVKGIWNMCRAAVAPMREEGGGSIVNISSLAAVYGLPNALHYTTSKAAVIGLTRGLARELGRYWIRVNAIAPSAVKTEGTREFFGDHYEHALDTIAGMQALRRSLEPADVAGTVTYLLSDASRFVTGQTLMVDGGTIVS